MEKEEVVRSSLVNEVNKLATEMDGRLVVSEDKINWEEAGKNLEWAILFKLASRRAIHKGGVEEVIRGIWRLDEPTVFWKVENDTLLVKFKSQKDQSFGRRSLDLEGCALPMQKWESGMMGEDFK